MKFAFKVNPSAVDGESADSFFHSIYGRMPHVCNRKKSHSPRLHSVQELR